MAIEFVNPDVAAVYEPVREDDFFIHVPARLPEKCYKGKISLIPMDAAIRLEKQDINHGYIKRKTS